MNSAKKMKIEAKLKSLLELARKSDESKPKKRIQCDSCNIIRRRAGFKDKRIKIAESF